MSRSEQARASRPISVCHIASGDRWAGAEVQVAMLLRKLARDPRLQLCAILLNEGRLADEVRACSIPLCVIPESRFSFPWIFIRAARFLRPHSAQVLHAHRYKENLLAFLLARRLGIPVTVRSQHGLPEPFTGWRHAKQRLLQILDHAVARHATDAVISVSQEMGRRLARIIPAERLFVIHNAIAADEVHSTLSPQEAKERLGFPPDSWLLGAVGRLDRIKRLDLLVAAAPAIRAAFPGAQFALVGEGEEEPRLRRMVQAQRLQDSFHFLGQREDIYDVLPAIDILILCSDHEGLPTVLLEALQLGVPVVGRRVGGVPEVVQDGVTGLLIDSGDSQLLAEACLRLLRDPGLRARCVREGPRTVAQEFSADKNASRMVRLYRTLLGEEPAGGKEA